MSHPPDYVYQSDFSSVHKDMYDEGRRQIKANKVIAVLRDYLGDQLRNCDLLDVGSSTGIMTRQYAKHVRKAFGVDIDEKAVEFSQATFREPNLSFSLADSMQLPFPDSSFDVVTCTHIYEHVPDRERLLSEIQRVLKPGGLCYFAAGNRFVLIEPHYRLPLLSVIPKFLAHRYLKIAGRGDHYYENHLSYWGLKKLTSAFTRVDYTRKIIDRPADFSFTETLRPGSWVHWAAKVFIRLFYWLSTDYIWLLVKRSPGPAARSGEPGVG